MSLCLSVSPFKWLAGTKVVTRCLDLARWYQLRIIPLSVTNIQSLVMHFLIGITCCCALFIIGILSECSCIAISWLILFPDQMCLWIKIIRVSS